MFLINSAWAQGGGGGGDTFGLFLPLILIFVVFYFLLIRPQQKRTKEHQAKIGMIQKGDKILTAGGVYGKVTSVKDPVELQVEISKGVEVKVNRQMVADVINPKAGPPPQQPGLLGSLFGGGGGRPPAPPPPPRR